MDGYSSLEDFITTGLLLDVFRPGRYVRRSKAKTAGKTGKGGADGSRGGPARLSRSTRASADDLTQGQADESPRTQGLLDRPAHRLSSSAQAWNTE